MSKWKVLIVDDEQPARGKLRLFLDGREDFSIVAEASDGIQALDVIDAARPNLIFLDIKMPGMDGISVAAHLENSREIKIVFVTAFNDFAVQAFELNACDYLLKPYDRIRFEKTVERLKDIQPGMVEDDLEKLVRDYRNTDEYPSRLMFKTENTTEVIKVEDIEWAEASANYVKICTKESAFIARMTMLNLLNQLNPAIFARVHRSHIVNIKVVKSLTTLPKGERLILLRDGTELKLSRSFRETFLVLAEQYLSA